MKKEQFLKELSINSEKLFIWDIVKLEEQLGFQVSKLPFSIKILVENLLRKLDGEIVTIDDLKAIAGWKKHYDEPVDIPHHPGRVLMQDFTGVPAVVDLAAMRDAAEKQGAAPSMINPLVPVELVCDHSVQIDAFGSAFALDENVRIEYERNRERYELLKWAQKNFTNFSVVPPNSGICHQVNLEFLARVIETSDVDGKTFAYPDTLVGCDSHTTMVNGIGVMGWGVGGIEAEAVMLGQPYYMSIPEVIGVRLVGEMVPGVTATDLVLTVTQLLRAENVVEKFVEFFGPGMKKLSVPDRATIANMAPEYGATMGFFPVDEKTIDYLRLTGRNDRAEIVDVCSRELGLFYNGETDPEYSKVIEFDLSQVRPSLAGHKRPQDRIDLSDLKSAFVKILDESTGRKPGDIKVPVKISGKSLSLGDGSVVVAAITSCTNTSNPSVMVAAGLVAKKAMELGLSIPPYVKTIFAPGSRVVPMYLEKAGLMKPLEAMGFHVSAFGCAACIGNTGPLDSEVDKAIIDNDLSVASVLSGNRNFEARIHQNVKGNFLASPPLVVAMAIAGRVDVDVENEPLATDGKGNPVYLRDLWPDFDQVEDMVSKFVGEELYTRSYETIFEGDASWKALSGGDSTTFNWNPESTYIRNPPYFDDFSSHVTDPENIENARGLAFLGDSVTTDHISPAGAIPKDYPAGQYLLAKNVKQEHFNSYGSRRGNDEVMTRGTFGNIRIRNQIAAGKEGGFTKKFPEGKDSFIYDAAMEYLQEKTPLIVLGGAEYGTGSSRDWAAKGTKLLGVRAVIANSFERIHRSNLVGMGVLPLVFEPGDSWESLGLLGDELFSIDGISEIAPRKKLQVTAVKSDGLKITFQVMARLDSGVDVNYFKNGGILPYVLREITRR